MPRIAKHSRRPLLLAALLATLSLNLTACFPLVAATGVGASVLVATDRRTSGMQVEDEGIELKVANRISEKYGSNTHINVTSYNRRVLLTGEAPTAEAKADIKNLAASVANVVSTFDEVAVRPASSFSNRSSDAVITSKVKARFVDANRFSANHVKVVTEAGIVYLLGLVTQREANEAINIARTTSGVLKVINCLEVISDADARTIDSAVKPSNPPQPRGTS